MMLGFRCRSARNRTIQPIFNQAMRRCAFFGLDSDPLMDSNGPAPLSHTLAWGYKAPAA
jgi:hypothetical protein